MEYSKFNLEKEYEKLKEELNMNEETINFIDAYYFNNMKSIFIELLKIYPEFISFKTDNYIGEKLKNKFNIKLNFGLLNLNSFYNNLEKNNCYAKLDLVLNYFSKNANEFSFENEIFFKYFFSFLINHGYFYYKLDKYFPIYSNKIKLLFDLSLNNYSVIFDENYYEEINNIINKDDEIYLNYICCILRRGSTDFLINDKKNILNNYLFQKYEGFCNLNKMINDFGNEKPISIEVNLINQNINNFLNCFLYDDDIYREDIIYYLDIGASLGLLLLKIYLKKNKEVKFICDSNNYLFKIYKNLFKLINTISSPKIYEKLSYCKKLILFSFFSIFNISPFPYNDKYLNKNIFNIYNYINGCLLNNYSILNNNKSLFEVYLDIFSDKNIKSIRIFNIESNNLIINFKIIMNITRLIISKLANIIFNIYFKEKLKLPTIYDINNNKNTLGSLYSSILYYYNNLNFFILYDEDKKYKGISVNNFYNALYNNFRSYSYHFPLMKEDKNYKFFYLNDYLNDLMIFNDVDYNVLYSFLINNYNRSNYNIYLLIFLLKEKWNIYFEYDNKYTFKKDSEFNYGKLNICLNYIKKGKTNIFISLVLLRRLFPLILSLINIYLKDDYRDENYSFKCNDLQIFSYENENIWDMIKENEIFDELNGIDKNKIKSIIEKIIGKYFSALKKSMKRFSEFGKNFNSDNFIDNFNEDEDKDEDDFWKSKNQTILIAKNEIKKDNNNKKKDINNLNQINYTNCKKINFNYELYIEDLEENPCPEEEKEEEEKEEEEEEEKEEEEEEFVFNKLVDKNIVIYFYKIFYESVVNRGIQVNYESIYEDKEIKGFLEEEYDNNICKLGLIDNDYYYLFEITFYCIYLELLELYFQIKNGIENNNSPFIFNSIVAYLNIYEKYSLYINFIDTEGSKTFIKFLCYKFFNCSKDKSELKSVLRKYLLENKKFELYYDEGKDYINIIKKNVLFVEKEIINNYYGYHENGENESLHISINENSELFKGKKKKEVKKFFEPFEYDNKSQEKIFKYFSEHVDNYLSIFEES